MPEGSVDIDGEDFGSDEDATVEGSENVNNQDSGASQTKPQGKPSSPQGEGADKTAGATQAPGGQDKGAQITDKGTKLDANPMSAVNQKLANAEAKVQEFIEFLSSPENVERYLQDLKKEQGQAQAQPAEGELSIDKVETVEDVQKFLRQYTQRIDSALKELQKVKYGIVSNAVEEKVNNTIMREIDEVQRKYSELRPLNADGSPNPDFDPELEKELGDLFDRLDLDPQAGKYRGSVSMLELADRIMRAAKKGQAQGSKKAQTLVQDRRTGRVVSGMTTETEPDESGMTASQVIAARMKRAASRR